MKIKLIPWFILLAVIITQFSGYDFFQFNGGSLKIAKKLIVNDHSYSPITDNTIKNEKFVCHVSWLYFVQSDPGYRINNSTSIKALMACSELYVSMLSKHYPENLELANLATQLYPDDVTPYYWLINATDPSLRDIPKSAVQKILSINPKDGLAWRYLGLIYLKEKDLSAAIDAHIQSCYNGDPGSNGCYNAGRLLEQEGRYEEAISFYRLSRHEPYRANADRLEEFLASSQ
jgi:tetratricopeptide (TPR) repeat protein